MFFNHSQTWKHFSFDLEFRFIARNLCTSVSQNSRIRKITLFFKINSSEKRSNTPEKRRVAVRRCNTQATQTQATSVSRRSLSQSRASLKGICSKLTQHMHFNGVPWVYSLFLMLSSTPEPNILFFRTSTITLTDDTLTKKPHLWGLGICVLVLLSTFLQSFK